MSVPDDTPIPPFVIDQRMDDDGRVLVTVSLPGLKRATLRVPSTSWIDGEHLRALDGLAATIVPPIQHADDEPYYGENLDDTEHEY